MTRSVTIRALAFVATLVVAFVAFRPGLSGPFFFDDLIHLPGLAGADGRIDTLDEVLRLAFPDGQGARRPLAYISLLISDNSWPTDPEPFKYFNLMLHLFNGVLVLVFARMLACLIQPSSTPPSRTEWVAILTMALWLLHPIHLSPTMLVVQRMTLIGGAFSLLALISYLRGRGLGVSYPIRGYAWMTLAFGAFLILGLLGKETATMTLCYVIALEATVLRKDYPPRPPYWNVWAVVVLITPLALICIYLTSMGSVLADAYQTRDFTLGERLLSEPRVLMQYIRVILLPNLSLLGPFQDDFLPSRGFMIPPTTALSLLVVGLLLALALWRRRRWPLFALAVLWFFVGHLLEGTVLPLELYFEHRNYLPMLGPVFVVVYATMATSPPRRRILLVGLILFIGIEATLTRVSGRTWGSADQIAMQWVAEHPLSARAQAQAIAYLERVGDFSGLQAQVETAIAVTHQSAAYRLYRLMLDRCLEPGKVSLGGTMYEMRQVLPTAPYDIVNLEALKWLATHYREEHCRLAPVEVRELVDMHLGNPSFAGIDSAREHLYLILSRLERTNGNLDGTIRALDAAYAARPSSTIALEQAFFLTTAGLYDDADSYLDKAASAPRLSVYDYFTLDRRMAELASEINRLRVVASDQGSEAPDAAIRRGAAEDPPTTLRVPDASNHHD